MAEIKKVKFIPETDGIYSLDTSGYPDIGEAYPCLLCGQPFLMRMYTGVPDPICGECFELYKDCATLVCSRCVNIVAKVPPKVLDNGYYIRPRSVLHLDICGTCDNTLKESTIIEIRNWEEKVRPKKTTVQAFILPGN